MASQHLRHVFDAAMPELLRLERRITPSILFRQRIKKQLHVPLYILAVSLHRSVLRRLPNSESTKYNTNHNKPRTYLTADA